MPELNLKDNIMTSLSAQEPWPDNVKLYQPYEVEQILLPDNASCLAVQAFLKMCNLPFEVEMRWNAEFMSPSGRVPFIKCGAFVVSELEPIVQFVANKGVSLCTKLSMEEKAEMRAYMSLITNVLVNAELYISWIDDETFNMVTKVRNSSVYPWPLGWFQTRSKRNAVSKRLRALNWHNKNLEQVLADVEQCCNSLSQRLGDKDFFFGTPTPLDVLIYGHMRALLSWTGPRAALLIKPITNALLRHTIRMATLTQMELSPQEEFLMSQVVSARRRRSPERVPLCGPKRRNNTIEDTDKHVFGFKPFASKEVIILTSKEGQEQGDTQSKDYLSLLDDERHAFVNDTVVQIVEKVFEITHDRDTPDFENIDEEVEKFDDSIEKFSDEEDSKTADDKSESDNMTQNTFKSDYTVSGLKFNEAKIDEVEKIEVEKFDYVMETDKCDFELVPYPMEFSRSGIPLEPIKESDTTSNQDSDFNPTAVATTYASSLNADSSNTSKEEKTPSQKSSRETLSNKDVLPKISNEQDLTPKAPSPLASKSSSDDTLSVEGLLKTLRERAPECKTFLEADVD